MIKEKERKVKKTLSCQTTSAILWQGDGCEHNRGMSRAPRQNANNFALSSLRAIHRLTQLAAHVEKEEKGEEEGQDEVEEARVALPVRYAFILTRSRPGEVPADELRRCSPPPTTSSVFSLTGVVHPSVALSTF